MPRTIETVVYPFKELSEESQQKAIENSRHWNVNDDWWDCTYDDAGNIGATISGFDTGRSWDIDIELQGTVGDTVQAIMRDHGEQCDTFELAREYFRRKHIKSPMDTKEFTQQLGQCYLQMLQKEYEYLTGDESIAESLEVNDVEFLETGELI